MSLEDVVTVTIEMLGKRMGMLNAMAKYQNVTINTLSIFKILKWFSHDCFHSVKLELYPVIQTEHSILPCLMQ